MEIREYRDEDKEALIHFMEELQDHEISLDRLCRLIRRAGYGAAYTEDLLEEVAARRGKIYIAEDGGSVKGCVVGTIAEQDSIDQLGAVPSTAGVVNELFVSAAARGMKIGARLMERIETYFLESGCDVASVEVFSSNAEARKFYEREGYGERAVHLLKNLK